MVAWRVASVADLPHAGRPWEWRKLGTVFFKKYPFYGRCHEWHHLKTEQGMKYDCMQHQYTELLWTNDHDHFLDSGAVFFLFFFVPSFFILKLLSWCASWRLSRWSYCLWISIPRRILHKSKKGIYQCEVRTGTKRKWSVGVKGRKKNENFFFIYNAF